MFWCMPTRERVLGSRRTVGSVQRAVMHCSVCYLRTFSCDSRNFIRDNPESITSCLKSNISEFPSCFRMAEEYKRYISDVSSVLHDVITRGINNTKRRNNRNNSLVDLLFWLRLLRFFRNMKGQRRAIVLLW
jgi:hypothetical protein